MAILRPLCRALNAAIIPDRYPIANVQECSRTQFVITASNCADFQVFMLCFTPSVTYFSIPFASYKSAKFLFHILYLHSCITLLKVNTRVTFTRDQFSLVRPASITFCCLNSPNILLLLVGERRGQYVQQLSSVRRERILGYEKLPLSRCEI